MKIYICLISVLFHVSLCSSIALPEKKCKISDSRCLKSVGQAFLPTFTAGFPELDVDPTDVLVLKTMKVELSGLNLLMKDVHIKGLKKAVIDKLSIDMAKKQLKLTYHAGMTLKGDYKASGQLIILPISGDGEANFKIHNVEIALTMQFDIAKNAEGKDVLELKSFNYDYDFIDKVQFSLSNLFNGNKGLSDTMHQFMNENWKLLTVEFGRPLLDATNKAIFRSIKHYLKATPLDEIAEL